VTDKLINLQSGIPVILITGCNGQVGWELQRSASHLGKVVAMDRQGMDLSDNENIRAVIRDIKPDVIINAAAYTAVDKAEEESELAYQINSVAPGVMAEEASSLGALLVHYSTDYVFNGASSKPYSETDKPDPQNIYGASKLAGELAIQESGCDYLIFRTSWVFASRGQNFLLSMLRLASERKELSIVSDQTGAPTSARLIADVTSNVVWQALNERNNKRFKSDLFHLVSSGSTSWHGFAEEIFQTVRSGIINRELVIKDVLPIKTEDYPTPATRPIFSHLQTDKLAKAYSIYLPEWSVQVGLCLRELND